MRGLLPLALAGLLVACGEPPADPPPPVDPSGPPMLLSGTGLYASTSSRQLAEGVVRFVPRYELWADEATKDRYIKLPPDETIDNSDPDFWRFPVGTKFFKSFERDGKLIETRMIEILADGEQTMVAYVWTEDTNDAEIAPDGQENALDTPHDVPDSVACEDCHFGEPGRALGFSAMQLAWSPGEGVGLADLVADGRLSHAVPDGGYPMPGTATVAAALGYMHANCGSCHNPHGASWEDTRLHTRLTTEATAPEETTTYESTIDREIRSWRTPTFSYLVVPGEPDESAMWLRMDTRDEEDAMPPIASEDIDVEGSRIVRDWILGL